ncbi:class I SAM-dependent methyltransferase [Hyphobacterium sp. HN65]|uniref:Class I SAM-dependent methyltransferase n=1 Tax=Hyphobacterium lacteum TaxID=3116575 RepID=A0ABU7LPQ5_9PROT|nr:class I SAM-dependent methyltransferase [Hyphobacterium sp. HN65]MEE2525895.1 class I SAM-dependent methyltransferase [Hyphobacterium sp. HN65]
MRNTINALLPRPAVRFARRLWRGTAGVLGLAEAADPALADLSGEGDWKAAGEAIALWARALAGVQTNARVLDIGCGPGRMAEGLLDWLDADGRYMGFDPSAKAIKAAETRLGSDSRASFVHADIFNTEYNPRGQAPDAEFVFPVEDDSIDFAFATSVFTHMRIDGVRRYIDEAARCLAPGGAFLFTIFLLDTQSRLACEDGKAAYKFQHPIDEVSATIDRRTPERAIAHQRKVIRDALQSAGLEISDKIHAGTWRGLANAMAFQDLIVAKKPVS